MRADHLVFVHGFTQTARSWRPIVERLDHGLTVTAVDAPGHGAGPPAGGDLWTAAEQVVAAGGRGTYVGYSMGARIALHAALARPEHVERLVLVSGTAGLDDPGERAERRRADEALAARLEREGVDAFLEDWLALPLFAGLDAEAAGIDDRRRNSAAGLAASLRHHGTGTQEPLWDRLGELSMPVLVVAGAGDPKFLALAERMRAAIPGSQLVIVDGAGHTVHLERPDEFTSILHHWLEDPVLH